MKSIFLIMGLIASFSLLASEATEKVRIIHLTSSKKLILKNTLMVNNLMANAEEECAKEDLKLGEFKIASYNSLFKFHGEIAFKCEENETKE